MATKTKAELFEVPATVKVSKQFLIDTIINAIEGRFGSWFPVQRLAATKADLGEELEETFEKSGLPFDTVVATEKPDEVWNEYIARNVVEGGTLTYFEDADETGDPADFKVHRLTREKLLAGLGMVLTKWPHLASPMGTDDDGGMGYDLDAIGADAVIQCALLNDLVYG
jgi:hypothetical protein